MATEVRFTPKAEQDLRDIWRVIATDNVPAADAFLLRLFAKLDIAATQPLMGAPRSELGPDARVLVEGRYLIIYAPQPYGILVVTIVHGMRDPDTWLR